MNQDDAASPREDTRRAEGGTTGDAASVPVRRRILLASAIAALVMLTLAVTALTVRRALFSPQGGRDLQWSPTRLFVHGINPYEAALHGSQDIILTQAPNYLHILYLLYSPLGWVSFGVAKILWLSINLALVVIVVVLVGRMASWNWWTVLSVGCVFLISTPTRFVLINGQTSLALLATAIIAFRYRERAWSGIALAAVLAKYSFLPIALCFVVQRRWKPVSIAVATSIVAWLLFIAVAHSEDVLGTAGEPLEVSRSAVSSGVGDLMSVIQLTLGLDSSNFAPYWAGLIAALVLAVLIFPRLQPDQWIHALTISGVVSLLCFKHLLHDYVFLLPALVIAGSVSPPRKVVIVGVTFIQWFGLGVLNQLGIETNNAAGIALSFASLCAILWAVIPTRRAEASRRRAADHRQAQ